MEIMTLTYDNNFPEIYIIIIFCVLQTTQTLNVVNYANFYNMIWYNNKNIFFLKNMSLQFNVFFLLLVVVIWLIMFHINLTTILENNVTKRSIV